MIQPNRRSLITGLISFMASPAIVRASSLMPINPRLIAGEGWEWSPYYTAYPTGMFRDLSPEMFRLLAKRVEMAEQEAIEMGHKIVFDLLNKESRPADSGLTRLLAG